MSITREDIFKAADEISSAGQQPTVANVRAKLGSGSFTTITAALRDWKSIASARPADVPDMPAELQAVMQAATMKIWAAANDQLTAELSAVRKAAEETATAQAEAIGDAVREIEALEKLATEQAGTIEKQAASLTEAQAAVADLRRELAAEIARTNEQAARIAEQAALLQAMTKPKAPTKPKTTAKPKTTVTRPDGQA